MTNDAKETRRAATIEAERSAELSVIGSILIDAEAASTNFDDAAALGIGPECFTSPLRAHLWRIMAELRDGGDSINSVVVKTKCLSDLPPGIDSETAVKEIVGAIEETVPSAGHLRDSARECLRLTKARDARRVMREATDAAESGDRGAAQWLQERLDEISSRGIEADFGRVDLEKEYSAALEDAGNPNRSRIIKTRFGGFDLITGGLEGGQLVVVAGRPSVGKTTLGFAALRRFVEGEHGGRGAFVSLEMAPRPFVRGLISEASRVHVSEVKKGKLTLEEVSKAWGNKPIDVLQNIRFYAPSSLNVRGLRAAVRDAVNRGQAKLVVVDYAGLLVDHSSRAEERIQLAEITGACKALARELDIIVILLAQAAREVDKDRGGAQLHHLKGAANLESDADIVVFLELHKECERGKKMQLVHWSVKKNRDGACGSAWYFVDNQFRTVSEPPHVGDAPTPDMLNRMHATNGTKPKEKKSTERATVPDGDSKLWNRDKRKRTSEGDRFGERENGSES